jgi:hypothetical protein
MSRHVTLACLLLLGIVGSVHGQSSKPITISRAVTPLRVSVNMKALEVKELPPMVTIPERGKLPTGVPTQEPAAPDPVIQLQGGTTNTVGAPLINIAGLSSSANPPDTVGDVGPNHYVQMVNATFFQVFNKSGTALTGTLRFGDLWPVGQNCRSNAGDPIVVYDHLADRWLLSQLNSPQDMCIAISQTPDPTAGTWFLYDFNMGEFPDYPKWGVWPGAYYLSTYLDSDLGVYAFDRAKMLAGQPATFVSSTIPSLGTNSVRDTRILPADLDGPAPPAGTPGYFFRPVDSRQDPSMPVDRLEIYEFAVNFAAQTFSFNLTDTLSPVPFNTDACNRTGAGIRDCVPEPATTTTVDALSNRPMMQLRFRSLQGGETFAMVVSQTVDVRSSVGTFDLDVSGIRWYELHKSGGPWSIFQQGTFAPQPTPATPKQRIHRWMGSAAMDKFGNIAVGYSVTNDDDAHPIFPGLRYVGHDADGAPGVMGAEMIIIDGTSSLNGGAGNRWGDYATMSVDPVDDCTFWFTAHIAPAGGSGPRPTRIAAFRFPACAPAAAVQ